MAGEHIQELSDENFEQAIASGVTLVDFFTDRCGPCRMLAPIFEEVAAEMHQKVQQLLMQKIVMTYNAHSNSGLIKQRKAIKAIVIISRFTIDCIKMVKSI